MKSKTHTFRNAKTKIALRQAVLVTGKTCTKFVLALFTTIATAIVSLQPALADSGSLQLQFEFSLSRKPEFRQFNLSLGNHSLPGYSYIDLAEKKAGNNTNVLLYSTNTQSPGLINFLASERFWINSLEQSSDDSEKSNDLSAGRLLLFVGVLGAVAYGIKKDLDKGCSGTEIILAGLFSQGYAANCPDE